MRKTLEALVSRGGNLSVGIAVSVTPWRDCDSMKQPACGLVVFLTMTPSPFWMCAVSESEARENGNIFELAYKLVVQWV